MKKALFALFVLLFTFGESFCQGPELEGKKLGIFFRSKEVTFNEDFYQPISQFLSLEEDRSWSENVKTELLIRVGEIFSQQLQHAANLDSAYFLNADLVLGKQFVKAYDAQTNRLDPHDLQDFDYVIVLNRLELTSRKEESYFIRSNQIIPQRVVVFKAQMEITLFPIKNSIPPIHIETCFDQWNSPKVPVKLDFFTKKSKLGSMLSQVFSHFYQQLSESKSSNCEE